MQETIATEFVSQLSESDKEQLRQLSPDEIAQMWKEVDEETMATLDDPKTGERLSVEDATRLVNESISRGKAIEKSHKYNKDKKKANNRSKSKAARKAARNNRK